MTIFYKSKPGITCLLLSASLAAGFSSPQLLGQAKKAGKVSEEGTWNVNDAKTNPVIGSKDAKVGGSLVFGDTNFPSGLNYMVIGDLYSALFFEKVVETMCETHTGTAEEVPLLAEKWLVSPDKMSIRVFLNPKAKYPDGSPVLTQDVKTYYEAVMNPKNLTAPIRASMETVKGIDFIDERTFVINFSKAHFKNIETMCSLKALQTKFWGKGDFNKDYNAKIYGSGPYEVESYKRGEEVTFKRRADYWGWDLPQNKGRYNFERYTWRKVTDSAILFELFKKGEIDMFTEFTATRWIKETNSEHFKKNWVVARRGDSKLPRGFQGAIMNTRRPHLKDVRVREALSKALDRKRFIRDIYLNSFDSLASYFPNSIFSYPGAKPVEYDLKGARKLLTEAGYTKVNQDGILLSPDGQPLSITFLNVSKDHERWLTVYKSDLKKIGVDFKIETTTWATLTKNMDTFNFDMTGIGWSGQLNPDPTSLWLSKYADINSSSNYPGLKDKEIDQLIEESYGVFDRNERAKIFHKIDQKLISQHPYILNWYLPYYRIAYQNKFGFLDSFIQDFDYEDNSWTYAWYDEAKAKALAEARKANKALPAIPGVKGPLDGLNL